MHIEGVNKGIPIAARRVFRLSLTVALSLAGAYALGGTLPYLAPIFALLFTLGPSPPMGIKSLFGLVLLVSLTMTIGLLLIPLLINYPATGLMIVSLGLFMSNTLSLNKGKGAVGSFLAIGLTLITAQGVANFEAALKLSEALVTSIGFAILCQRIVYPLFPEDAPLASEAVKEAPESAQFTWIAMRATLIVLPAYLMALINPAMYLPIVMKSVSLGQQGSVIDVDNAGTELLWSTFVGGFFAIIFWFTLKLEPNLWMFFLWMLLFGLYFSSKVYRLVTTRFAPSFWINVFITMLILVGPAVADSASGKDVYKAFAVRMILFVAVTLYAWAAIFVLECIRTRRINRVVLSMPAKEEPSC